MPNTTIADFGTRGRLRVFFPGLFSDDCDVQLTVDQQTAVYTAMRRAIGDVDPVSAVRWSATYLSALRKAMKPNRRNFQWSTNLIAEENTTPFLAAFHHHLTAENVWAADVVFQFQIQGVKDLYQHNRTAAEAEDQLDVLMQPFDSATGEWFIDVGLDIHEEGVIFQWRTTAHGRLLSHLLDIDDARANRACNLHNRRYHRDIAAHLPDLSGFRLALQRTEGGLLEAVYIQAYTSDKALAYQRFKDYFALYLTGHMAVKGMPPIQVVDFYDLERDAAKNTSCSVRLEIRVPLKSARRVLMRAVPEWLLNASILVFSLPAWWSVASFSFAFSFLRSRPIRRGWRSIRVYAVGTLLSMQNKHPKIDRCALRALTLTVGLTWLVNGIHCRPLDNAAGRDVMLACLPTTRNHNDPHLLFLPSSRADRDDLPVPYCPYNAIYLRQIIFPPDTAVPRLVNNNTELNPETFKRYFGLSYLEYHRRAITTGILQHGRITRHNIPAQKRHTKPHLIQNPAIPQSLNDIPDFYLPVPGREEWGADIPRNEVEEFAAEDDAHARAADQPNSLRITLLMNMFVSDVFQKVGNSRGDNDRSHCKLTISERCALEANAMCNLNLSDYFWRVSWRHAGSQCWRNAFNLFFPPRSHQLSAFAQGYGVCAYYLEWKHLMHTMDDAVARGAFRRIVWSEFRKLRWVPDALNDRIWDYKPPQPGGSALGVPHAHMKAPRILVRLQTDQPQWNDNPIELAPIGDDAESEDDIPLEDPQAARPNLALYERHESEESSEAEPPDTESTRRPSIVLPPRSVPVLSVQRFPADAPVPVHPPLLDRREQEEDEDPMVQQMIDDQGAAADNPTPFDPYAPRVLNTRDMIRTIHSVTPLGATRVTRPSRSSASTTRPSHSHASTSQSQSSISVRHSSDARASNANFASSASVHRRPGRSSATQSKQPAWTSPLLSFPDSSGSERAVGISSLSRAPFSFTASQTEYVSEEWQSDDELPEPWVPYVPAREEERVSPFPWASEELPEPQHAPISASIPPSPTIDTYKTTHFGTNGTLSNLLRLPQRAERSVSAASSPDRDSATSGKYEHDNVDDDYPIGEPVMLNDEASDNDYPDELAMPDDEDGDNDNYQNPPFQVDDYAARRANLSDDYYQNPSFSLDDEPDRRVNLSNDNSQNPTFPLDDDADRRANLSDDQYPNPPFPSDDDADRWPALSDDYYQNPTYLSPSDDDKDQRAVLGDLYYQYRTFSSDDDEDQRADPSDDYYQNTTFSMEEEDFETNSPNHGGAGEDDYAMHDAYDPGGSTDMRWPWGCSDDEADDEMEAD